jgi:hypothetical protein
MRSVYAIQFEIRPGQGDSPESCFDSLKQRLATWVRQKYQRAFETDIELAFDGKTHRPTAEHEFSGDCKQIADGQLCALDWTHPGDQDSALLWYIESRIARKSSRIQFSLRIRVTSLRPVLKPLVFELGKPRIVDDIINSLSCSIEGFQIPRRPGHVGITGVSAFINENLRDRNRVLPTIVLSPDPHTDRPIVNPYELQDALIGFASVFVLESKWVSFALTESVGRDYTCFNGAVRLYWPGFEIGSNPWDHPLYFPDRVRRLEFEGRPLKRHFFEMLASVASFRFREATVIREVADQIENEAIAETESLRSQLRGGKADLDQVMDELERAWDRLAAQEKERAQLKERVSELEDEVDRTKENLASMWEFNKLQGSQEGEASVRDSGLREYESVSEALEEAELDFGEVLDIWDSARKSAEDSYYRRPLEIYKALMAINDLGSKIGESKRSGTSVGRYEDHFKDAGLKYAPTESQTTLSMYGNERKFTHKGTTVQMLKHLTIGGGSGTDCVQIYFEPDKQTGRIAIGHCGRHLSFSSQRG